MSNGIFITGTDTDVGKTIVSASIAYKLSKSLKKVCIMKPFATSDKIFSRDFRSMDVYVYSRAIELNEDEKVINPSFLELAGSPYMSSQILNLDPPDIKMVLKDFFYLKNKNDFLVVEGIGGLMVPLNQEYNLIDFIKMTELGVIIVTTPKLGTLNHTLMTVHMCRHYNIPIRGIIVNKMPLEPHIVEQKTPLYIHKLTKIPILGIIPRYANIKIDKFIFKKISELIHFCSE